MKNLLLTVAQTVRIFDNRIKKNFKKLFLNLFEGQMIIVNYDGVKYVATMTIDEKDRVRREGFVFDKEIKKWVTHDAKVAYRLYDYMTSKTKELVDRELGLTVETFEDLPVTRVRNMIPFEHQIEAAKFVLSRHKSYLAMEAGTGKTPILPMCMNNRYGTAIVVCPAFLVYNWEVEIETWLEEFANIQTLRSGTDKIRPHVDVLIVPDSIVHKPQIRAQLVGLRPMYLFIDEWHRFKSKDAKRTKAMRPLYKYARHVVGLSGTPMPSRPIELWATLNMAAPHAINYYDEFDFAYKFCDAKRTQFGWDYRGSSNLLELSKLLKRNFMLVKRIDECVDLPKRLPYGFIYINGDPIHKQTEREMELLRHISLEELISYEDDMLKRMKVGDQSAFNFMSELRKTTGLKKISQSASIIKGVLEDKDKVVVFAWHTEVIEKLAGHFKPDEVATITGKKTIEERHKIVAEFQSGKKLRLLILNIQAGGVGITLTASDEVLFVEPSYVPAENDQAVARLRRIGQKKKVRARFIVWRNSLDHLVLNLHQKKTKIIKEVI